MVDTQKKKLTLSIDSEIIKRAEDLELNKSDFMEKILRAYTYPSKKGDEDELYKMYQELFDLMLPLLKKFHVHTQIGQILIDNPDIPEEELTYSDEDPPLIFNIYLEPNGGFTCDGPVIRNIKDISPHDFFKPQYIVDTFLSSIQEGVNYRKKQFKEIEMAKTIIDAITKTTFSRTKKSKGNVKKK